MSSVGNSTPRVQVSKTRHIQLICERERVVKRSRSVFDHNLGNEVLNRPPRSRSIPTFQRRPHVFNPPVQHLNR